jgi:ABC-type dipeptide/oligopeptide/nickel transport system ATPase component
VAALRRAEAGAPGEALAAQREPAPARQEAAALRRAEAGAPGEAPVALWEPASARQEVAALRDRTAAARHEAPALRQEPASAHQDPAVSRQEAIVRSGGAAVLSVHLSVDYRNKPGVLRDVEFDIRPGEAFGLVGASGSGKSTIALAILRLLGMRGGAACGSILFEGRELLTCGETEMRQLRGRKIALVPQSPASALNPALRLETHLREAWRAHSTRPWKEVRTPVRDLLMRLELPADEPFFRRYPHQISVGQAQRVLIAMAVLHRPALLIADEPTSALDTTAQREILALLRGLNREFAMAVLYISHDLASVAALCQRVGVLRGGRLAECGPVDAVMGAEPSVGLISPGLTGLIRATECR